MRLSADVSPPVPDSQGQPQPHTDPAEDRPTEGTNRKQIHGSRVFYHADNSREHQIHITDERPQAWLRHNGDVFSNTKTKLPVLMTAMNGRILKNQSVPALQLHKYSQKAIKVLVVNTSWKQTYTKTTGAQLFWLIQPMHSAPYYLNCFIY